MNFIYKEDKIIVMIDDEEVAFLYYRMATPKVLEILKIEVKEEYRGRSIASICMSNICSYVKDNNLKIKATCSYAKNWLLNHNEYLDLMI